MKVLITKFTVICCVSIGAFLQYYYYSRGGIGINGTTVGILVRSKGSSPSSSSSSLVLPGTRLCRLSPQPHLGQPNQQLQLGMFRGGMDFNVRYQCDGPAYNHYIKQSLAPYIKRKQRLNPNWGKRPTILPPPPSHDNKESGQPSSSSSRSILIIGNSHMNQISKTLFGQYVDQFINTTTNAFTDPTTYERSLEQFPTCNKLSFRNSDGHIVNIAVVVNHADFYSSRWKRNLEESLGLKQSLSDVFDVVIVGSFNHFQSYYRNTRYWRLTDEYGHLHPTKQINLQDYPNGIPLMELVQEFGDSQVPIIRTSMFSQSEQESFHKDVEYFESIISSSSSTHKKLYYTLNARQHLSEPEFMIPGGNNGKKQCTSPEGDDVQDCAPITHKDYDEGHRCMGSMGGEPDVVVFDLVEQLWEIFADTK